MIMKHTFTGLMTILLAGGVHAATFPDLEKNTAELKAGFAVNQIPDASMPAAAAVERITDRIVEFPDTDMEYFKKSAEAVCYGAYYARSDYHNCSELKGDAKAICDGLYYAGAQYKNCADLDGDSRAICYGFYFAGSDHHHCSELTGDAKAICDGVYYSGADHKNCADLSGNGKAVCDGLYYARADHKNCADLNGGARTICYGMYYAASDYRNCSELKDINENGGVSGSSGIHTSAAEKQDRRAFPAAYPNLDLR